MTWPSRNLAPENCWSESERQEWAIGMLSSEKAKFRVSPCHSFSAPNFQESSKQSERKYLGSRQATKCTGQRTSTSQAATQNMHCLLLDGWPKNRRPELHRGC